MKTGGWLALAVGIAVAVLVATGAFAAAALATTVIVPPPVPGARCEATLERGALMPVEAAGPQRFVQRAIEQTPKGAPTNGFMFVDCATGKGVGVVEPTRMAGQLDPYVIRQDTTVAGLAELAARRGHETSLFAGPPDIGALTNPFCGCHILYPDSIGATYGN